MPADNDILGKGTDIAPAASADPPSKASVARGGILIVDDNPDDAVQAKKIFDKLRLPIPVYVVFSGEEALAYLEGQGRYENRVVYPYPIFLLLDLRMPGWDGFEVLKWMNKRREHRQLPVVVLSVVRELSVVSRAYELGARSFLIKPLAVDELKRTLSALKILPDADIPGKA